MKPALPVRIDRMPREARDAKAGLPFEPCEVIAIAITYAMQFEFWKREISPKSQVVIAIEQALKAEGYKIVPMERTDYSKGGEACD